LLLVIIAAAGSIFLTVCSSEHFRAYPPVAGHRGLGTILYVYSMTSHAWHCTSIGRMATDSCISSMTKLQLTVS